MNWDEEYWRLQRETTALQRKFDAVIALNAELTKALFKLKNEIDGLRAFEEGLREVIGNINYNILIQRANEARAAIAKARG